MAERRDWAEVCKGSWADIGNRYSNNRLAANSGHGDQPPERPLIARSGRWTIGLMG
jgi:hypothetical protein